MDLNYEEYAVNKTYRKLHQMDCKDIFNKILEALCITIIEETHEMDSKADYIFKKVSHGRRRYYVFNENEIKTMIFYFSKSDVLEDMNLNELLNYLYIICEKIIGEFEESRVIKKEL